MANLCLASRKDFREAVKAARTAFVPWSKKSAYFRGQILYRMAEMLEGRRAQFISELVLQGSTEKKASEEVSRAVDCLVYYAGWADKYQQIFSSVNPVNSSHFSFSVLEAVGVVGIICPDLPPLYSLVANIASCIVSGNSCVVLASEEKPLNSITFAEVLQSSDLPGGVVNILTGKRAELSEHFGSHMDLNTLVFCALSEEEQITVQKISAENMKRMICRDSIDWNNVTEGEDPYLIHDTLEVKTIWHPVGQ